MDKSKISESKQELRAKLRARIDEQRIIRSSALCRRAILDKTMKEAGIDKEKLKEDLERIGKQGNTGEIRLKKE